ncbi:toll/interleukin-1 receptor domain-containing protein [Enterococcus xiangfangensis]|uniref:Toll/interleukin-1 receptor domain-containing protein n=1 Tax=Enterococcus xiangfangensis TaxID=1296537 RepID=A0ABU3F9G0_9ENTE|nr:toll/interleukin-1 receptor domain-containing protein [Enterococcus xiangfangensis]MDT2759313.1 toll/interleukin-1 receptor domain-containing protein [Enterococcus xiangfangensis]
MSISSLQQKEKTLLNDINRLERNLASEQKKASDADKKIADSRATISRSKVATTIRSKERTIESETKKSVSAKSKVADISGKIAKKRKELGDTQVKLSKARTEESEAFQKDFKRSYDRQITKMKQIQNEEIKVVQSEILNDPSLSDKEFDIFISYASEDSEYVDKLEESFKNADFSVWRDKSNIGWGQTLRQSIDNGLIKSKFGLVVLSSKYIQKYWTGYELDGILNKESSTGRQMILPLWHNVTKDEIDKKSPSLSNRLALDTRINSLDEIVENFKSLLE